MSKGYRKVLKEFLYRGEGVRGGWRRQEGEEEEGKGGEEQNDISALRKCGMGCGSNLS